LRAADARGDAPHGERGPGRRLMATWIRGRLDLVLVSTTLHNPLFAMLAIGLASFSNDLVMPGAWTAAMDVGGKYAERSPAA